MDQFHRAAQLWPLLITSARNQKLLSYDTVRHSTGLATPAIGPIGLGPIFYYCVEEDLPWLTSIVIQEGSGIPGNGFMDQARETYGPDVNIHQLQSRVFVYDWFKRPAPTPDDFERAANKHRSTAVEAVEELEPVS